MRSSNGWRQVRFAAAALVIVLGSLLPMAAQSASPVVALQESLQNSIERLQPSLIPLVAMGSAGPQVVGTGFFVSPDGEFVTAAHVLRQPHGLEIRAALPAANGERKLAAVAVIAADERHELALCRVAPLEKPATEYRPVKFASAKDAKPGTLVLVSGFPLAAVNSSSHLGIVSSRGSDGDPLEVSALVNEGESGAPIVRLEDNAVIGMVISVRTASTYVGARRGVEEQNSGLALGSLSDWISELLERAHREPPR